MQNPEIVLENLSEDLGATLQLGYAWISKGSLDTARTVFDGLTRLPLESGEAQQVGLGLIRMGDVLMELVDYPGALIAYRARLEIRSNLSQRDPSNTEWQRELSLAHDRIGDVLMAQGDFSGALSAYRAGLEIAESLVHLDPEDTEWQRDLAISHSNIGKVLLGQEDSSGALAAYRTGLEIRKTLAQLDPEDTEWQRDLSISHDRIGQTLQAQGNWSAALASYRQGLAIAESLVRLDPENTEWQRDLAISHNKIGDALVEQGESRKARAAYGAGLEIAEALAQQDTQNMQRQLDIATFCAKLGSLDCLMATKARRQYLTQGREAIVSLKSQEQLAEYKDWIDLFDAALKHSSWLPWNAARSGLNVIGIGLLAIHILQNPFNVEPGWVAIHLALVISVSLFFGVVFALVDDRPLGTEKTDYQEVNGRILATVKRHPIRLALLIPGEDGIFFVPLLWVGISPFTAGVAAAAFAAFHYPEYPIKACIPKFVFLYGVAMVVLPHGIGSVVVGHLLADAVGFLLLRLLGDD